MDEVINSYLISKHVEGIALNENTILLRQKPRRASALKS